MRDVKLRDGHIKVVAEGETFYAVRLAETDKLTRGTDVFKRTSGEWTQVYGLNGDPVHRMEALRICDTGPLHVTVVSISKESEPGSELQRFDLAVEEQ